MVFYKRAEAQRRTRSSPAWGIGKAPQKEAGSGRMVSKLLLDEEKGKFLKLRNMKQLVLLFGKGKKELSAFQVGMAMLGQGMQWEMRLER